MSLAPGLTARQIRTSRLLTNVHTVGDATGTPVVLVHGNVSSNRFFDELLLALPAGYYGIAPDLRGYGASETLPVDATRGVRDWSDDLRSLFEAMGLADRAVHLLGWSMGGGVRHAVHDGSSGPRGVAHPAGAGFALWLRRHHRRGGDAGLCRRRRFGGRRGQSRVRAAAWRSRRLADVDANSPRAVMNTFYFRPPFQRDAGGRGSPGRSHGDDGDGRGKLSRRPCAERQLAGHSRRARAACSTPWHRRTTT